MYYLVYPDGSRLFREPVSEDFAYHCLLLAIDKDLGLKAVKAPVLMELYFFCRLPPSSGLTPFPCQPVTSLFPVPSSAPARVALLARRAVSSAVVWRVGWYHLPFAIKNFLQSITYPPPRKKS